MTSFTNSTAPQCVMGVGPDLVTPRVGCDQSKSDERAVSRIHSGDLLSEAVCTKSAIQASFRRSQDFIPVKSNRSSHMAKKPYGRSLVQLGQSRHKSKLPAPRAQSKYSTSQVGSCNFFTSPVIIIRFLSGQDFNPSGRLLRLFGHHLQRTSKNAQIQDIIKD